MNRAPRTLAGARRRNVLALGASASLLAACGFKLRQAPDFVFTNVVIVAAASSPLANELRRNLAASGKVTATVGAAPPPPEGTAAAATPPASAASARVPLPAGTVILDLLLELREKVVVGLNASGQVREFQLRERIRVRLRTPQGRELIPDTELLQTRDISFNEAAVLAKESEEALLFRDMQSDLVQQVMRRLAAVKTL